VDGLEEEGEEGAEADREELEKNAKIEETSRALRSPTSEEQANREKEFEEWSKKPPEERAKEALEGLRNLIRNANSRLKNYGQNAFSSTQILFAGFGQTKLTETNSNELQNLSDAQRAAIGGAQALVKISTPRGPAEQSLTKEAYEAVNKVSNGATLYKVGTIGTSNTTDAQFWSLENPSQYLNNLKEFAQRYGIPEENLNAGKIFIQTAQIRPGTPFVTRPAPAVGANKGGQIEVVVNPGGVKLETFSTVNQQH
jgi:exonuclease VII large subunit